MSSPVDAETRTKVEVLAVAGVPHDQIADIVGISKTTMYKHYRQELDIGLAKTVANLANTLVQKALNGDNTCLIFFLKTKGRDFGWAEGAGDAKGKKEQAHEAAQDAAKGKYAPPAPPRVVVNNG